MEELGVCDRAFEISKANASEKRQVFKSLATTSFDHVFSPHRSVRTAILVRPLKARKKIGFHEWWNSFAFDQRVAFDSSLPDALRQLSLLKIFDDFPAEAFMHFKSTPSRTTTDEFIKLPIPEEFSMTLPRFSKLRDTRSQRVLMAPGSVWPTKRWTTEGYTEVARTFISKGFEVVLVGSPDEKDLCTQIADAVPAVKNCAGQYSLIKLLQIMATSRVILTNDSGAMHLAAVAGLPTVTVFGPTTLAQGYRPWQNSAVVVQKDLDCRPCGRHGGKKCPLGHHHCMKHISSSEVMKAADILLRS